MPGSWQKDVEKTSDGGPEYCIDAVSVGNVARFINHSCQPNLFVQCVLSSHHDIGLARVVLMAADNIPPLQVLAESLLLVCLMNSIKIILFVSNWTSMVNLVW